MIEFKVNCALFNDCLLVVLFLKYSSIFFGCLCILVLCSSTSLTLCVFFYFRFFNIFRGFFITTLLLPAILLFTIGRS